MENYTEIAISHIILIKVILRSKLLILLENNLKAIWLVGKKKTEKGTPGDRHTDIRKKPQKMLMLQQMINHPDLI